MFHIIDNIALVFFPCRVIFENSVPMASPIPVFPSVSEESRIVGRALAMCLPMLEFLGIISPFIEGQGPLAMGFTIFVYFAAIPLPRAAIPLLWARGSPIGLQYRTLCDPTDSPMTQRVVFVFLSELV